MVSAPPPPPRKPSPPVPWASQVPRKPTEPGLARPAEDAFTDTEEPTKPGAPEREDRAAVLIRLYRNLTPEERRRLVLLADAWFRCDANDRAVVEAVVCRLALPA